MKRTVPFLAATSALLLALLGDQAHAAGSADSVVKVFSQMRLPNPIRPWIKQNPVEVMGSGVVIEGKRILTNAHLVLYADEIFVQGGRGGDRVEAKVAAIGPGIDLAVLTLDDEAFFAKRPPIAQRRSFRRSRRGSPFRAFRSAAAASRPPRELSPASSTTSTRAARLACGSRSMQRSTRATAAGRHWSTER